MMSNWKETLKMALPWSMSNSSQAASIVSIQNEHNSCPKGLVICRGGMIFTFFKAEGISVGKSLVWGRPIGAGQEGEGCSWEEGRRIPVASGCCPSWQLCWGRKHKDDWCQLHTRWLDGKSIKGRFIEVTKVLALLSNQTSVHILCHEQLIVSSSWQVHGTHLAH